MELPISEWDKTIAKLGESESRYKILPILKLLAGAKEVGACICNEDFKDEGQQWEEVQFWIRRGEDG